jgi:hypothetical protein
MKKVWILLLVAAVVLAAGPVIVALAQDAAPGGGPAGGGKAGGKGGRGGFGQVTVTEEQAGKLKTEADAVTAAAKDLSAEATKVLGEQQGPMYAMQAVMAAVTELNPPPAATDSTGKGGKGGGGFGKMEPIKPTDDQMKTLQPKLDAVKTALKALSAKAKEVLGDTDGPRYTRQVAMQAVRPAGGGMKGAPTGTGGGKRGGKGGAAAAPATT